MKTVAILTLTALLAACGGSGRGGDSGGSEAPNYPPVEEPCVPALNEYDFYGTTGLVVERTTASCLTAAEIEALYYETMTCAGVALPTVAVRVEFISYAATGRPATLLGSYQELIQTVWVNTDRVTKVNQSKYVLAHEFIHHALYVSGVSHTDNAAHNSLLFAACT